MSESVEQFYLIGIAVRTTNENEKAATDISKLWDRFLSENMIEQIPGKIDHTVYSVYTEYEKDFTKPYTTILGCRVANLNNVPDGFKGISIEGGNYMKFTAKGKLSDYIVIQEWMKIWNSGIQRIYTADFEVYGHKTSDPENAEVDIFIAIP
ncbi:GyrI-like domain-containing protein [Pedobacter cryoconitis]|uniref:Putative transcriptional regulator YdeE n=1 Tax=Pedobacter cryoconitis TaxID=188932 RepID=A0A7X0MJC8_9SPHI|nr:GyrI-like domain-containing protein [Pedobacter cryoconitis]MBB6501034.1 putative transcriptional regulator YdeE [Pedobacter cryoconitis]